MTRTSVELTADVDSAWTQLQQLGTWDGVAGMEDLHDESHDAEGDLSNFKFSINTAVGRVNGTALVTGQKPAMTITGEQKGLAVTLSVVLKESGSGSIAMIDATSKATSFLSKPLEKALNLLLDSSLAGEAAVIADRVV